VVRSLAPTCPACWSAALVNVPTRPAPSEIGAPPPAAGETPDVAAAGDDAGPTQRELPMELREGIKGLKTTVDAIAKDQALGVGMTGRGDLAGKERKAGRGERTRASGTRQIRGCRVTVGGSQGPVDLLLTA
jgi:hypothetical protein